MVSTRSQSVLSADAALGDTAGTQGEVSSAAGPTPRRSGRLRPSGGAAAAEQAAPPTARTARSRRPLKAIQEEEAEQAAAEQAAAEQAEGAGEQRSPRARRRPAAAASEEEAEADGEEEGSGEAQPLRADASLVDLLAQEMFAALDSAFGQPQGGSATESDSDDDEQQPAAATQQQQQQQAADGAAHSDGSSSSDSEGEGADHQVPAHLRWRPELTLPGMGAPQQQQHAQPQRGGQAAGAAGAAAVHVVRRGGKDSLHVPPPDERAARKAARKAAPDTAGKAWFDLPATQITEEVKNDLRMLRLRGALDPKAHYKKLDSTKFPKYFQLGTVVAGAADFYSGRLTNKQRKRTLTDEIMADTQLAEVRKKRFTKLQEERSQWSKKRTGRKTDNERRKKAAHRPKH